MKYNVPGTGWHVEFSLDLRCADAAISVTGRSRLVTLIAMTYEGPFSA